MDGLEWKDFGTIPVSSLTRKIFEATPLPAGEGAGHQQMGGG